LDFINASSLTQQSVGRHVAPLGHIILSLSLLLLINTMYIAET